MTQFRQSTTLLLIIAVVCGLTSCFEDQDVTEIDVSRPDPREIVTASIHGIVVNDQGLAQPDAAVSLFTPDGWVDQTTDEHGYFLFANQQVPTAATLLVKRNSNQSSRARINIAGDRMNFTTITLLEKITAQTQFSTVTGGTIEGDFWRIDIPVNSLQTLDGSAYSGLAVATLRELTPAQMDAHGNKIGDLSGLDNQASFKAIQPLGLTALDLYSSTGTKLRLDPNQIAAIALAIPNGAAQQEIPIWVFDDVIGEWIQQATASTLDASSNKLVGEVQNLNAILIGNALDAIQLKGQVKFNFNGLQAASLSNRIELLLSSETYGDRLGYATPSGDFIFNYVPKDETFTLTLSSDCDGEMYTATVGPFTHDQILDNIAIDISRDLLVVEGAILDCQDELISSGIIKINAGLNRGYLSHFNTGQINLSIDQGCLSQDEVFISVLKNNTLESHLEYAIPVTNNTVDLGAIVICEPASDYIQFKLDGEKSVMCLTPNANIQPSPIYSNLGCSDFLFSILDLEGPGIYNDNIDIAMNIGAELYTHADPQDLTIHITQFGSNLGDQIIGTAIGKVRKIEGGGVFGPPLSLTSSFNIVIK